MKMKNRITNIQMAHGAIYQVTAQIPNRQRKRENWGMNST